MPPRLRRCAGLNAASAAIPTCRPPQSIIDSEGKVLAIGRTARTNAWTTLPSPGSPSRQPSKTVEWDRHALVILPFDRGAGGATSLLVQLFENDDAALECGCECAMWVRDAVAQVESFVWDPSITPSEAAYEAAAASHAATLLALSQCASSPHADSPSSVVVRQAAAGAAAASGKRVRLVRQVWRLFDRTGTHLRGVLEVDVGVEAVVAAPSTPVRRVVSAAVPAVVVAPARQPAMGVVVVRVLRGVELPNREVFGKQDPYVKLELSRRRGGGEVTGDGCRGW